MERACLRESVGANLDSKESVTDFCIVGSLLDVPTHTVNMTTLRSTHDLWQSYSMSPYEVCILLQMLDIMLTYLIGANQFNSGTVPNAK